MRKTAVSAALAVMAFSAQAKAFDANQALGHVKKIMSYMEQAAADCADTKTVGQFFSLAAQEANVLLSENPPGSLLKSAGNVDSEYSTFKDQEEQLQAESAEIAKHWGTTPASPDNLKRWCGAQTATIAVLGKNVQLAIEALVKQIGAPIKALDLNSLAKAQYSLTRAQAYVDKATEACDTDPKDVELALTQAVAEVDSSIWFAKVVASSTTQRQEAWVYSMFDALAPLSRDIHFFNYEVGLYPYPQKWQTFAEFVNYCLSTVNEITLEITATNKVMEMPAN